MPYLLVRKLHFGGIKSSFNRIDLTTMWLRFSQRIGKTPIKVELERETISPELRNVLWSVVFRLIFEESAKKKIAFCESIYQNFYKIPIDEITYTRGSYGDIIDISSSVIRTIRDQYYQAEWYEVLDFIEYCSSYHYRMIGRSKKKIFEDTCNFYLKREVSAYRFLDGVLSEINSKEEVIEIETALNISDKYSPVKKHLKQSLQHFSNKQNPDYRNSIKESILAVESIAKIITGNDKTTLGQGLKEIEKIHQIPPSLKKAFSALYGYTSSEGGIRHALLEDSVKVDQEEARFMLITCSAFVNYLLCKV